MRSGRSQVILTACLLLALGAPKAAPQPASTGNLDISGSDRVVARSANVPSAQKGLDAESAVETVASRNVTALHRFSAPILDEFTGTSGNAMFTVGNGQLTHLSGDLRVKYSTFLGLCNGPGAAAADKSDGVGIIVIPCSAGLTAYNLADGSTRWTFTAQTPSTSVTIQGGKVIIGTTFPRLVSLDVGTGLLQWAVPPTKALEGEIIHYNGVLFCNSDDAAFAYIANTGVRMWRMPIGRSRGSSMSLVETAFQKNLLIKGHGQFVFAWDVTDTVVAAGQGATVASNPPELWRLQVTSMSQDLVLCQVVKMDSDHVLAIASSGSAVKISLADGSRVWSTLLFGEGAPERFISTPIVDSLSQAFITGPAGLNRLSLTGQSVLVHNATSIGGCVGSPLIRSDGRLVVGQADGFVASLCCAACDTQWNPIERHIQLKDPPSLTTFRVTSASLRSPSLSPAESLGHHAACIINGRAIPAAVSSAEKGFSGACHMPTDLPFSTYPVEIRLGRWQGLEGSAPDARSLATSAKANTSLFVTSSLGQSCQNTALFDIVFEIPRTPERPAPAWIAPLVTSTIVIMSLWALVTAGRYGNKALKKRAQERLELMIKQKQQQEEDEEVAAMKEALKLYQKRQARPLLRAWADLSRVRHAAGVFSLVLDLIQNGSVAIEYDEKGSVSLPSPEISRSGSRMTGRTSSGMGDRSSSYQNETVTSKSEGTLSGSQSIMAKRKLQRLNDSKAGNISSPSAVSESAFSETSHTDSQQSSIGTPGQNDSLNDSSVVGAQTVPTGTTVSSGGSEVSPLPSATTGMSPGPNWHAGSSSGVTPEVSSSMLDSSANSSNIGDVVIVRDIRTLVHMFGSLSDDRTVRLWVDKAFAYRETLKGARKVMAALLQARPEWHTGWEILMLKEAQIQPGREQVLNEYLGRRSRRSPDKLHQESDQTDLQASHDGWKAGEDGSEPNNQGGNSGRRSSVTPVSSSGAMPVSPSSESVNSYNEASSAASDSNNDTSSSFWEQPTNDEAGEDDNFEQLTGQQLQEHIVRSPTLEAIRQRRPSSAGEGPSRPGTHQSMGVTTRQDERGQQRLLSPRPSSARHPESRMGLTNIDATDRASSRASGSQARSSIDGRHSTSQAHTKSMTASSGASSGDGDSVMTMETGSSGTSLSGLLEWRLVDDGQGISSLKRSNSRSSDVDSLGPSISRQGSTTPGGYSDAVSSAYMHSQSSGTGAEAASSGFSSKTNSASRSRTAVAYVSRARSVMDEAMRKDPPAFIARRMFEGTISTAVSMGDSQLVAHARKTARSYAVHAIARFDRGWRKRYGLNAGSQVKENQTAVLRAARSRPMGRSKGPLLALAEREGGALPALLQGRRRKFIGRQRSKPSLLLETLPEDINSKLEEVASPEQAVQEILDTRLPMKRRASLVALEKEKAENEEEVTEKSKAVTEEIQGTTSIEVEDPLAGPDAVLRTAMNAARPPAEPPRPMQWSEARSLLAKHRARSSANLKG